MIETVLLSYGSLFFSLLLTIVYYLKSKQTNINNRLFTLLLIILDLTIISEIVSLTFIYYFSDFILLEETLSRVNLILTISWIMCMISYVFTIGHTREKINYRKFLFNNKFFRTILIIYIILIIISFFLRFNNIVNENRAYFSGPAVYIFYLFGILAILGFVITVIKTKKEKKDIKLTFIIIGIFISLVVLVLQLIFPAYLMLTCIFVFDTYILYFMFENPDLYLIDELKVAKKNAEDSSNAKTDFLSNMSHEIRTPMNAFLGFSEGILSEKEFNFENIKKDVSNINFAGNNLLEIINNILDISKIESGKERIENIDYNIDNMTLELKNLIDVRIGNKKIKFMLDINPSLPKYLKGDKTKIYQILLNVLGNAVKYTEVGKIIFKIDYEILKDNNILLHFSVEYTGCGIKEEDFDKIFEKFSRLDLAVEKEIEGTGLGLVIVKKLVNLLGGKIWFESVYNVGTIFYIDLIQSISDKTVEEKVEVNNNDIKYLDCSSYKILLVDDNKLNLKVAEKVLSNYNFQINKFDNGKDCINDIKKGTSYDLIFLDHMMPEMDGIEVLHILKKLEGYNLPPIIVLTANAIAGMREMYLSEGFDDYLSKPINVKELDKIINKYFNSN